MADSDLLKLYSGRILALTTAIPHAGRLEAPDGTGRARSPLCGSTVTVDVGVAGGRVAAFAQEVRACALGQAAAAVAGAAVLGRTRAEVAEARTALAAMLAGGPPPGAPWDGFEALAVAREHPNRHASILLAFDATLLALEDAMKKAAAAGATAAE